MHDSTERPNTHRGKKWNRSKFVQKMKRHGQRGSQLQLDEFKYLSAILDNITGDKETEDRQLMASNVMGQLKGKEIRTAMNLVGSRVLENLIVYTDEETFAPLMDLFAENFRVFCGDKFASHVLQRVLSTALLRAVAPLQKKHPANEQEEISKKKQKFGGEGWNEKCIWPGVEYCLQEEYSEEHRERCCKFVERMARFLMNNLEEFVANGSACHAIRQIILHLAGITEKKPIEGNETKHLTVPEAWQKLLHEFSERLLSWPQFSDFASTEASSVLLQDLLRAVAVTNDAVQLKQLLTKIYKEVFLASAKEKKFDPESETQPNLPSVFTNPTIVRLLEMCIAVAPVEFLKNKLYVKLFRGHVQQLALSKAGLFAVQKLIDHTTDKDLMDLIFSELEDSLEQLLSVGHTGVLLVLARACGRLNCQQGKFVKLLLDALHCGESATEKLIMAVLGLHPADGPVRDPPNILMHGSLILQAILFYTKPIKFVTALLGMPNDRLAEIFMDQRGSFIANAFVESKFVGEKSREKMVRHLEGQYSRLALHINGSRVVEIMFEAGNPAQRESIVRELAEECLPQLNNRVWGAKINKRLLVETYKQNPAQWRVLIKRDVKVTQLFTKLVGGKKRKLESSN
ncbi:nucleolar protein 9 [Anopheles maculipalpis]|uniref:nucleolar protein 9 n=1 Tax=Anopheles maculipalpis TaxID=1496333 RepID=UPI002159244E|nr:nucleolar protein 9 [Anopheles maculipalpis]